jgi:hypothetical protein
MRKSIIISVKKGEKPVSHLAPVSFEEAGIREVQHLQEWILEKPDVLGEELMILSDQYSQFEIARDRLDILCLDRHGHPVVVELKRTDNAGYADLQSLRYAALVRTIRIDQAADALSQSRRGKEQGLSKEDARKRILEFIANDEDGVVPSELLSEPRIIIASSGFSPELLTTVRYLKDHDIDVTCISLSAYSVGGDRYILVPDVEFPLRAIEDVTTGLRKKDEARRSGDRTRSPPRLRYLIDAGQIKDGDVLLLKHGLPDGLPSSLEDDPRFRATVEIADGVPKIRWEKDGSLHAPSDLGGLMTKVLKEVRPDYPERTHNGYNHWGSSKESLTTWAQRIMSLD